MSEVMAVFEPGRQLLTDLDRAGRTAIERELDSCRQSLKREMSAGVSRQEFANLAAVVDAIDAATELLNII